MSREEHPDDINVVDHHRKGNGVEDAHQDDGSYYEDDQRVNGDGGEYFEEGHEGDYSGHGDYNEDQRSYTDNGSYYEDDKRSYTDDGSYYEDDQRENGEGGEYHEKGQRDYSGHGDYTEESGHGQYTEESGHGQYTEESGHGDYNEDQRSYTDDGSYYEDDKRVNGKDGKYHENEKGDEDGDHVEKAKETRGGLSRKLDIEDEKKLVDEGSHYGSQEGSRNEEDGEYYDEYDEHGEYYDDEYYSDDESYSSSEEDDPASELYNLCLEVSTLQRPGSSGVVDEYEILMEKKNAQEKWQDVRTWISFHPDPEERKLAATQVGKLKRTALHLACQFYDPPIDVIRLLLECSDQPTRWEDATSCVPLHIACTNGANSLVIEELIERFPQAMTRQDRKGCTPLHYAMLKGSQARGDMAIKDRADFSDIIRMLCDSGAPVMIDEKGWLPLHYACAFGTSMESLQVLLDAFPDSISKTNSGGQTALHLAMVNAKRSASPEVIEFLLSYIREKMGVVEANKHISKQDDNFHSAIALLVDQAGLASEERAEDRKNIAECLNIYLSNKVPSNIDLMTSLDALPDWLRYPTVINENVQQILNDRVAQRFPTFVLLSDLYMLITMIIVFPLAGNAYISYYFDEENGKNPEKPSVTLLIPVYVGASYFLLRETLQVISIIAVSFDRIKNWYTDSTNWVDVIVIFIVMFFTLAMNFGFLTATELRAGVAWTIAILWFSLIIFIKSTRVEFAVFVDGLVFVLQRLVVFLLSLFIILFLYATVFVFMYKDDPETCPAGITHQDEDFFAHCVYRWSLLRVYTMLMGEVNSDDYVGIYTTLVFVSFVFLVVILLSNVLIAIVTDSYAVIQDERAEMVFWSNRLDFVAEMAGLSDIPCFNIEFYIGTNYHKEDVTIESNRDNALREAWKTLLDLFDTSEGQNKEHQMGFCLLMWSRCVAIILIPLWVIVGFASVGLALPPQFREKMLVQSKTAAHKGDEDIHLVTEVRNEIRKLKKYVSNKMKQNTAQMAAGVDLSTNVQAQIMSEVLQVREIAGALLDLTKSMYS